MKTVIRTVAALSIQQRQNQGLQSLRQTVAHLDQMARHLAAKKKRETGRKNGQTEIKPTGSTTRMDREDGDWLKAKPPKPAKFKTPGRSNIILIALRQLAEPLLSRVVFHRPGSHIVQLCPTQRRASL